MRPTIAAIAVLVLCATGCDAVVGSDGCSKDSDCKGNRLCVESACVESEAPASAPAPAAPAVVAAAAPSPTSTVVASPAPTAATPEPVVTPTPAAAPRPARNEADPSVGGASPPVATDPEPAAEEERKGATASIESAPAKPVASPQAKRYAATIRGVCEKFVDCGCEASIASCEKTVGGQTYAKAALKCVTRLDCGSMCGRGPAQCVERVAAAEAAASREAHDIGRRIRDNWPTGDDGTCPPGTRRSGGYCYSN